MLAFLKSTLRQKGFKLFTRPYELNIVGVRSNSTVSNRFDDALFVFYRAPQKGVMRWKIERFAITTDPGTYWLNNPSYENGTAILISGQYRNAYSIGMHRGKYEALVQSRPVKIMRDYDRDAVLDFFNGTEYTGMFGINIHRASAVGTTKQIEKYSAGCQVFSNADDFAHFMQLCHKHASLYGNQFTYTLLDHRAQARTKRRYTLYALSAVAALGILGAGIFMDEAEEKISTKQRSVSTQVPRPAARNQVREESPYHDDFIII
jgi:hypothetical protein